MVQILQTAKADGYNWLNTVVLGDGNVNSFDATKISLPVALYTREQSVLPDCSLQSWYIKPLFLYVWLYRRTDVAPRLHVAVGFLISL